LLLVPANKHQQVKQICVKFCAGSDHPRGRGLRARKFLERKFVVFYTKTCANSAQSSSNLFSASFARTLFVPPFLKFVLLSLFAFIV